MSLSWHVQNIVVIGRVYSKLEHSEFSSNFEFDRNMLSGTGAWWHKELRHQQTLYGSFHYIDVIMTTMASQITSLTVVYSTVYSGADQRKQQSSASLAFVWGIHRDRWIPRIKGQLRGKCFHLMTSSCHPEYSCFSTKELRYWLVLYSIFCN